MKKIQLKNTTQKEAVSYLLDKHTEFSTVLDSMFKKAWQLNAIEPLMEIRSLNSHFISKYQDLVMNDEVIIEPNQTATRFSLKDYNLDLWELNFLLSQLLDEYNSVMSCQNLNSFVRMLVSIHQEKLLNAKENLLHPIPQVHIA